MAVNLFSALVLFLGIIPFSHAGTRCSSYPGGGYCIASNRYCPTGTKVHTGLSNVIGCPSMSYRCCVRINKTNPVASCGKVSLPLQSRIFNGVETGACDWPWVVSIRALLKDKTTLNYQTTNHFCGGTLIDKSWVLTTATCVIGQTVGTERYRLLVVAGEYNKSGIDIYPLSGRQQEQIINVGSVFTYPSYPFKQESNLDYEDPVRLNSHNVALIKLATPITGKCSGLICLPTQEEADNDCASYNDCVITGWGYTSESYTPSQGSRDTLKMGRVKVTSNKGCNLVTQRKKRTKTRPAGSLCQMPADNYLTDGCVGDEGGAIMCSNGHSWVVRGIIPRQWCNKGQFNLFSIDVAPYLQWIKSTMANNNFG